LVPDHVNEAQQGRANGLVAMLSVLGALLGAGAFTYVGLAYVYAFYILILALSLCATMLSITEVPLGVEGSTSITFQDLKHAFWLSPVEHKDFFCVTLSRTFYYMGCSSQTFFMYYLKDIIRVQDPEGAVLIASVLGQCFGAFTAYPAGWLSDHLQNGRKVYVYVACTGMALGNVLFLMVSSFTAAVAVSALLGAANGMYLTMDNCLAVETLPNKKDAARFMGMWGIAAFVGTASGPLIGGPALYIVGRTETEGVYSIAGYAVLLCFSAFYMILSAVVIRKVHDSANKSQQVYQKLPLEMEAVAAL